MFPLFLDLTDRTALVVGGGLVGRRKAAAIRAAGGQVRLVCLEPCPDDASDLDWRCEPFQESHLDGVALVFAAATSEVNTVVAELAQRRGLWVNVADAPDRGNFHAVATVRRGDLLVAIGTGGAAPALARRLRQRLEVELEGELADWVDLLAEARPIIRATITEKQQRQRVFDELTQWSWLARLRADGIEATRAAMLRLVESARSSA